MNATKPRLAAWTRWVLERDMVEILAVERASSPADPWVERDFRHAMGQANGVGVAAEVGGRVAGYAVCEVHPRFVRLLNLAVAPQFRRRSVASQLLTFVRAKYLNGRRSRILLDVSEDNLPAHCFFRAQGFRAEKVLRDFYPGGLDAYRFTLTAE